MTERPTSVDWAAAIRTIGAGVEGGRDLDRWTSARLFGAMLDGEVPDLELGAILIALRLKGEALDESLGFLDALASRVVR